MNFFEAQARAKKHTFIYVLLFIIAIGSLIVLANFSLAFGVTMAELGSFDLALDHFLENTTSTTWIASSAFVLGIVIIGNLYMMFHLSKGGEVVASSLGGRKVNRNTKDFQEKQLLNVVEEMAIASGIAVPPVYIIADKSINAFAAGHSIDDVAIGVTRGLIDFLDRDELQGVIAHEFSHIFNGDMKINMRLTGGLHGILLIGLIGEMVLRTMGRGSHTMTHKRSKSKDSGGLMGAIIVVGVSFYVIGFVGKFMGGWIKAIISRKREYLADATAVQYTRYPQGIAGALKKIGGSAYGSQVSSSSASTHSHLFFSNGLSGFFTNMFATHPPLEDRILAIDPRWNGDYPLVTDKKPPVKEAQKNKDKRDKKEKMASVILSQVAINSIGHPSDKHIYFAKQRSQSLNDIFGEDLGDTLAVQGIVFALLADADLKIQERQKAVLSPVLLKEFKLACAHIKKVKREQYIELIRIIVPTLKSLSSTQYKAFKSYLAHFIEIDNKVTLFEWSLQHMILRPLDKVFLESKSPKMIHATIGAVKEECEVLFSMLSQVQYKNEEDAQNAFTKVMKAQTLPTLKYVAKKDINFSRFTKGIENLEKAKLPIKKRILETVLAMVMVDEKLSDVENEMIHTMAEILEIPLPPLQA